MSAAAVLEQARTLGVSLRVVGDKIRAKGPGPAVERLLPVLREHKLALLSALAHLTIDPNECSDHWLISLPPEKLERWFSPAVTRAELEQRYPGAVLVALPPVSSRATAEEAAELRRLVDALATREGFTEDEREEALENALRDPQGALRSFKAMLEER